ncbi:MAG: hypothetical protein DUD31_09490 [Coriobacteriaceae bacterium]|uniref:Uncharacterized protein n=1 Tax=Candidatus Pseudoramibacter fermentans TaxID=2594427 RepID=A0A6L5GUE3_9FIRM|nr:hypothetical protein [Candidatus Pseudoramibacter fermentans]RRF91417.1 MAG: hypothetical protein DUD31_09490 [Coriobacteriaceae bacterium]
MARVFKPIFFVKIPTSGNYHPKGSFFKASIGTETDEEVLVFKVQLVVDEKIRPRLTLSYDYKSRQFEKIIDAYGYLSETYDNIPDSVKPHLGNDQDITKDYENSKNHE